MIPGPERTGDATHPRERDIDSEAPSDDDWPDREPNGALEPDEQVNDELPVEEPKGSRIRFSHRAKHSFDRADHVELAVNALAELKGVGPELVFDEGHLYRFDKGRGLWAVLDEATVSRVIQSFAGTLIGPTQKPLKIKASDVSGATKLAGHRVASPEFFAAAPRGLAFANGFVSVSAGGVSDLRPHAPEHRARFGYSFNYERSGAPKLWLTFLDSLFRDDTDKQEKILFLQEFFGASLVGIAPVFQRCFVAVGDGENGKSKLGDVILAAMPAHAHCSIPPQDLENEYRRAMLAGKRLNFVSELPEATILASESFKAIIDGSAITGRHIREAPFDFRPVAGHYYAANKLPGTNDQTHAFWRRFVVVRFGRVFADGDPERDPRIAEKIIEAELPAVAVWLLDGARRVLQQGAYTIPPSHAKELAAWRMEADQVALFLDERTRPSNDVRPTPNGLSDWIAASALYDAFVTWADRNRHRPMASNKFGGRMRELKRAAHRNERGAFYPVQLLGPGDPPPPRNDG